MELSRRADYGIRVMLHLASLPQNKRASTQDLAVGQSIPAPFLAKIISQLSLAGLLTTFRGAGGGVSLSRHPSEISLFQVIEALDGPIRLNRCLIEPQSCPRERHCPVHNVWKTAQTQLASLLQSTTFDVLVSAPEWQQLATPD